MIFKALKLSPYLIYTHANFPTNSFYNTSQEMELVVRSVWYGTCLSIINANPFVNTLVKILILTFSRIIDQKFINVALFAWILFSNAHTLSLIELL